jgi:hypothetical protein
MMLLNLGPHLPPWGPFCCGAWCFLVYVKVQCDLKVRERGMTVKRAITV